MPAQKLLLTFLIVASTALTAAEPELSGSPDELRRYLEPARNLVTVFGYADQTAYADLAHVRVVVTTTEDTMADAVAGNAELRVRVTEALIAAGIDTDDIKAAAFSSSPQYGWFGRQPKEYVVSNSLKITARTEAELTAVAREVDAHDELQLGEVAFEHSGEASAMAAVREAAVEDALAIGRSLAEPLALTLAPVTFEFRQPRPAGFSPYTAVEEVVVTARRAGTVGSQSSAPAITFDEVTYQASVSVTFDAQPAHQGDQ